jgi:hypothetical protein
VSAISGRNAWAVGRHGDDTAILHWDGTGWSRVTSPNLGSDFNELDWRTEHPEEPEPGIEYIRRVVTQVGTHAR